MPTITWYAVAVAVLASPTAQDDAAEECARRSSDLWSCLKNCGAGAALAALAGRGDMPLAGRYVTLATDVEQDAGRRVLRVSVPLEMIARLIGVRRGSSDARGKKDKGAGVMMLGGMMMMTTLASAAFGSLALLAAKGLMTSVLALALSAMAVSKRSGGGHGHARTTYEVIDAPHAAAVSEVHPQYISAAQSEPVQYGDQRYD